MRHFGLLGKSLSHSFSKDYFLEKFKSENITNCQYDLFPVSEISELKILLEQNPNLEGLNITIPYKEAALQFCTDFDQDAKRIGAVNVLKISKEGKVKGFNTDNIAFEKTIEGLIEKDERAIILGTGGASKAIAYTFSKLGNEYLIASRNPDNSKQNQIAYEEISPRLIKSIKLIINTTPLGMFPDIKSFPNINYNSLNKNHILYDLIYNPTETEFLRRGRERGAKTINGLEMLKIQAELSWDIWNK